MMWYIISVLRAISGMSKIGTTFVRFHFTKRAAVKRFEKELVELGMARDVVRHLTAEYADMVSLNPMDYAKIVVHR